MSYSCNQCETSFIVASANNWNIRDGFKCNSCLKENEKYVPERRPTLILCGTCKRSCESKSWRKNKYKEQICEPCESSVDRYKTIYNYIIGNLIFSFIYSSGITLALSCSQWKLFAAFLTMNSPVTYFIYRSLNRNENTIECDSI